LVGYVILYEKQLSFSSCGDGAATMRNPSRHSSSQGWLCNLHGLSDLFLRLGKVIQDCSSSLASGQALISPRATLALPLRSALGT
jgi:hypothetical protein